LTSLALAVAACGAAQAPAVTAQSLLDRAQISDLITRYYYNLGHASADSFAAFYTEDAQLVLGAQVYEGREGIEKAYQGTGDSPQRRAFAFNIVLGNMLVMVEGDRARAQVIFTEYLTEKQGDPPRVFVQGREYDWFVKQGGQWRFSKRQIMPGAQVPEGWTN
jgi:ketosteroid isomerase-like protein